MATGLAFGWCVQNANGTPVSGAKVYFYAPGTTTPRTTYTDQALTVPAANPVVADSAGWFLTYISSELAYDVVIKSADDSITYQERRVASNISGAQPVDATLSAIAAAGLEARKLWRGVDTDTIELVTSGEMFGFANVLDFGATGDGVTDDTAAIQAALNASQAVGVPPGIYLVDTDSLVWSTMRGQLFGISAMPNAETGGAIFRTTNASGDILTVTGQGNVIRNIGFELSGSAFVDVRGVYAYRPSGVADVDIDIQQCRFNNLKTNVHVVGRGLIFKNNVMAGSVGEETAVVREWIADGTLDPSDFNILPYGFRKDQICGNYCHSSTRLLQVIGDDRKYYRGILNDNMCDNGARLFLGAFSDLTVTGNHVKHANGTIFDIDDDSEGLVMTGNNLSGTPNDAANSPAYIFRLNTVDLINSTITGNKFASADETCMLLNGPMENVTIGNNTISDWNINNAGGNGGVRFGNHTYTNVSLNGNTFQEGANTDAPIRCAPTPTFVACDFERNTWDRASYPLLVNGNYTDSGNNFINSSRLPVVIAQSGTAASHTGSTAETALATVSVPAGLVGANGTVRISAVGTITSSVNNKTPRIRIGGIGGTVIASTVFTTNTAWRLDATVQNRNSAASQRSTSIGNRATDQLAQVGGAVTSTIDTASAFDIVISGELADGGDTISVQTYQVEVIHRK